jgi:molecular chaperone HscB
MTHNNFFEVLGIPVSFIPDMAALRKKYYQLSRQYHPDVLNNSGEEVTPEDVGRYERINEAYETLSHKWKRLKHILEIYDVLHDPEHEKLPLEFLQDMMEINEELFELQMDNDEGRRTKVLTQIQNIAERLESEYEDLVSLFENQEDKNQELQKLKDYYLKSKYILRIQENLSTFASGSRGIDD